MAKEVGGYLAQRSLLLESLSSLVPRSLRYVAFDQLHADYGVLHDAEPNHDIVVMVESEQLLSAAPWHPERLYFYRSSARHFARELAERAFTVRFHRARSTMTGLAEVTADYPGTPLIAAEQSSRRQHERLTPLVTEWRANDFFMTPRDVFATWAASQKSPVMENFYRGQRTRVGVLMDGDAPLGGAWNFDKENRQFPPKRYEFPPPLEFDLDDIDRDVSDELRHTPSRSWATTRAGARAQMDHFFEHHFAHFGPYEDAMVTRSWSLHHSLLSPYLNIGLLHPREVLDAAVNRFARGDIPIASAEGFIRQLIGWREYVQGMYWFQDATYHTRNELDAQMPLLPLFDDADATSMACVSTTIRDIDARAWTHHIPRLMVLSNLALLTGVQPQAFLAWMRRRFIDAAEWVMVPNVIGMAVHADGGAMMTKPYAAGGAYIDRMSDYCKGCRYNPKVRTGDDACPFTTLYWDFLARHEATFATNHRMAQQLHGLSRLRDITEVRIRARDVLDGLRDGHI